MNSRGATLTLRVAVERGRWRSPVLWSPRIGIFAQFPVQFHKIPMVYFTPRTGHYCMSKARFALETWHLHHFSSLKVPVKKRALLVHSGNQFSSTATTWWRNFIKFLRCVRISSLLLWNSTLNQLGAPFPIKPNRHPALTSSEHQILTSETIKFPNH